MKIVSFNVNGLRAVLRKGFSASLGEFSADIVCLQEIKACKEQIDDFSWLQEHGLKNQFWNSAEKKGYSGVAIFCKKEPLSSINGIGVAEHDAEGRVLTLEFEDFYLVNVYTPNSKRGLLRLDYRMEWDTAFLYFLKDLGEKKPVIFCGDLNVSHKEIDLANPKGNKRNAGFTEEERNSFSKILEKGEFIDSFRHFYPDKEECYTWWSNFGNARSRNIGWRLDYFNVSKELIGKVKSSEILADIMGSDHCPIILEVDLK